MIGLSRIPSPPNTCAMSAAPAPILRAGLLTLGALLLLSAAHLVVIYVTDDDFASDSTTARAAASGRTTDPAWTVARLEISSARTAARWSPADPLGLAAFSSSRPACLDSGITCADRGPRSYGSPAVSCDRTGAVLAGIAFAGSGYIACQLKHLAIVSTVVWLPIGLTLLDRALAPPDHPGGAPAVTRRVLFLGLFGLVFAQQALSGFPQSVYICGLVYGAFAAFRAIAGRRDSELAAPRGCAVGVGAATALAPPGCVRALAVGRALKRFDRAHASMGVVVTPGYWPWNVLRSWCRT